MTSHVSDHAGEELSELSMELQQVEWLTLGEPPDSQRRLGSAYWNLELSLVLFGALLGVAFYFSAAY